MVSLESSTTSRRREQAERKARNQLLFIGGRTGKRVNAIPGGAAALPLPQLLHYSTRRPHLQLELLQAPRRRAPCPNTHGRSGNEHETTFPQAEWARAGADTPLLTYPALWWSWVLQHGKRWASSNLSMAEPPQDAAGPRAGSGKPKKEKKTNKQVALLSPSKGLNISHEATPEPPRLLCPLRLLHPPCGLVPKSEPANQQLPAAALRLP